MSKIDNSLFSVNKGALKDAYGDCPDCGGELSIKHSKNGPFVGCLNYPTCEYKRALNSLPETEVVKTIEGSKCPQCSASLVIKKGRYGLFIGCEKFPECGYHEPINKADDTHLTCPSCNKGHLVARTNKFGKSFYACDAYPKCRYIVNHTPVKQDCPECQWPIMVEKKVGGKQILECPQRRCGHRLNISQNDS